MSWPKSGVFFGSKKQLDLTLDIGKQALKRMRMEIAAAGECDPDRFFFQTTLWDAAQNVEELAQLALFRLIRVDCYLHRHEYAECIGAAEDLFTHCADDPDLKEFEEYVRAAHSGVSYARAALIYQALARGEEGRVREEAREMLRTTHRIRHKEWDFIAFIRAYSNYLLGDMEAAKMEATRCARLADAQRRCQLLSMIELEKDYEY